MSNRRSYAMPGLTLAGVLLLSACGSSPEPAEEAQAVPEAAVDDTSEADRTAGETADTVVLEAPVKTASADPVRGPNGLEERCLSRVGQETGARVIGTNRIEESEAAIEIYVNVEGAQAPWKCLGNKDGSISEVMFTGSEGYL